MPAARVVLRNVCRKILFAARHLSVAALLGAATTVAPLHAAPGPQAVTQVPTTSAPASPAALSEAIRERVDRLRYERSAAAPGGIVRGAQVDLAEGVARFYEASGFQPEWQDPVRLDELIASIADLKYDGLEPTDYHVVELQSLRSALRERQALPPAEQADLEILATDAMMLALYHLQVGKVDPATLSPQWNFQAPPVDLAQAGARCCDAVEANRILAEFEHARPQQKWYRRGRERLKEYYALRAAGGWSRISAGPALKPGMSDPRVPALRYRLQMTGDMPAPEGSAASFPSAGTAPGAAAPIGAATPSLDTSYDAAVEAGVRRFQQRHGIAADGVVGPGTLAALNVSISARIDQLRVNMERARWVMHELTGDFVLVDVAGFDVSWFRDDAPVWTSKVIVGRPYRETPVFKATITYVVFNPTWTIPPGILVKDKLPVIRKDPGYLQRNNIRVIDSSGRGVDPYAVNWNAYSGSRLPPYQLRQDPGEDNALGLVKIMFPNRYSVYLHDTPTKSLFDEDQRTFSSGCIRVQKAFELAELVLQDPDRWNQATIQEVVAAKETKTVTLARPVPVLILYWTAQPTPDGQVMFRNDIYARDPPTLAALDAPVRPMR